MKKEQPLFFVALVPPAGVFEEVQKIRKEVEQKFDSRAALKSPPHITLHMPFRIPEKKFDRLRQVIERQASIISPFTIEQNGFGCFEPRVVFVNVERSAELLNLRNQLVRSLRLELGLDNSDYKNQGFQPHMTIAFRDLKKQKFHDAWRFYKSQPVSFHWMVKEITLLKHNGKNWDINRSFPLLKKN